MTAPAAGGGDTRDGREVEYGPRCYCRVAPHAHYHPTPARPAAAPADDTGELREPTAREMAASYGFDDWDDLTETRRECWRDDADRLLALPAVRDLTDGRCTDRARIAAVEALADEFDKPVDGIVGPDGLPMRALFGGGDVCWRIRRALGGER